MTRQIVRLDSNTTQQSINLEFDAEILSVINPTAQSIGVSVGGNIPPQTVQSADIWIPADSGINYPVVGRNFAAAFMPPLLVNAPTGIPTAANLFFTAQEAVPNFGAFPLSTLATQSLADVTLRAYSPLPITAGNQFDIAITPDIQSITVVIDVNNISYLQVPFSITGKQSGLLYFSTTVPAVYTPSSLLSFPIFAGLDTALTFAAGSNAPHSVSMGIIGHRYIVDKSSSNDQLQTVRVLNGGNSAAPIPLMVSTQQVSGAPVGVNPTWARQPDYSAYQRQVSPTVTQNIATISGIPNGVYRIEWDISCESPTAATNKKAYLIDTTNSLFLAAVPFPGSRSGVITAYGPGNAFALAIQNGIAITDGSYLSGAIRVWKL